MEKAGKENGNNCGSVPLFPTLSFAQICCLYGGQVHHVWDPRVEGLGFGPRRGYS